jgi:hypothetical protein
MEQEAHIADSPNLPRRVPIRDSRLSAISKSRPSWPSSQAIRYCRPLMAHEPSPASSTERMVPIAASSRPDRRVVEMHGFCTYFP